MQKIQKLFSHTKGQIGENINILATARLNKSIK
jgi:hypothetical protein